MFTKTSTHIKLQKKYLSLQNDFIGLNSRYQKLINQWNDLVGEINEKGGRSFMDSKPENHNLTDDDIKKLLTLCHPDKHGGKSIANDMTAKLNKLRTQQ
ncbi:hypothetical protein NVP1174O_39 [Vibrio phage 1.174.O._10N.261.55.A8]|nr:hypothetical protein NVP1174O_39 [Vibrio phage 1.174.O._10N.261.55.A8]